MNTSKDWPDGFEEEAPEIGMSGFPDDSKYTRDMAREDKKKLEAFLAKRGLVSKSYNDFFWQSRTKRKTKK
jgi:hypothetical protein